MAGVVVGAAVGFHWMSLKRGNIEEIVKMKTNLRVGS
jgi:hypothetical protein